MKEALLQVLQALLIAAVPVITGYAVNLLHKYAEHIKAKTKSANIDNIVCSIETAVDNAINYTSQIYVDKLKEANEWTLDNQRTALKAAIGKTKELLNTEAIDYIHGITANADSYIETLIEAAIKFKRS